MTSHDAHCSAVPEPLPERPSACPGKAKPCDGSASPRVEENKERNRLDSDHHTIYNIATS